MNPEGLTRALCEWQAGLPGGRVSDDAVRTVRACVAGLAGIVVYGRCGQAAKEEVTQAAMMTLRQQLVRSAIFPCLADDPHCDRKNFGYLRDTVRSRFVDAVRQRQRGVGDCGHVAPVRMGEGEATQAYQLASEALILGGRADVVPDLAWMFEVSSGHSRKALLAQRWPDAEVAERDRLAEHHKRVVSKAMKNVLGLLSPEDRSRVERLMGHLKTRPKPTQEPDEPDWDAEQLLRVLDTLHHFGVVQRAYVQLRATGQDAGKPAKDLDEMVALKFGKTTVPGLLGIDRSHPDFTRLRNALYKRHDRTRVRLLRVAVKLSAIRASASSRDFMLPVEDLEEIEALLQQLKGKRTKN